MVLTRTGKGVEITNMAEAKVEELEKLLRELSDQAEDAISENATLRSKLNSFAERNKENSELEEQIKLLMQKNNQLVKKLETFTKQSNVSPKVPGDSANNSDGLETNEVIASSQQPDGARRSLALSEGLDLNVDLVNGVLSLYEGLLINIKLPKYDGENSNPMEFLDKIEKYFRRKSIADHEKLPTIEDALEKRAHAWYEARLNPFLDYNQFKRAFVEEFYSPESKIKYKDLWKEKKFKVQDGSLLQYFNEQRRTAKYLVSVNEYEINYTIINQLPLFARDALASLDYTDLKRIQTALARLDETHKEARNNFEKNQMRNEKPAVRNIGKSIENRLLSVNDTVNSNVNQKSMQIENWRQPRDPRVVGNDNKIFILPHTSKPPPNVHNSFLNPNEIVNNSKQSSTLSWRDRSNNSAVNAIHSPDFVSDLCWDFEGFNGEDDSFIKERTISPRIQVSIFSRKVVVLIDTGSDITCVSESFYNAIKQQQYVPELPVTNFNISVAAGKKTIGIRKKLMLPIKFWKFELDYTYLVVPGLTTEIIIGVDFLKKYGGVIDFRHETFELCGEKIPDTLVQYKVNSGSNDERASYSLQIRVISSDEEVTVSYKGTMSNALGENRYIPSLGGAHDASLSDKNQNNEIYAMQSEGSNNPSNQYNIDLLIKEYVVKLNSLNSNEKQIVYDLLMKHKRVFLDKPGSLKNYAHVIRIKENKPFVKRPYPVPLHIEAQSDKEIESMLQMSIIQRSTSEYCSPLRVVLKKTGGVRVCLDARYLNKLVGVNNESLQQIEQLMIKADNVKYFSTTDLVKGYWQIKLARESRKLTAFLYDGKLYEYKTLAFGVKNSGPAFIQALDYALGREIMEFVSADVDDLLIMSTTFEEHVSHLAKLFQRLIDCNLTLSLEKSYFFRESVPFLGFIITRDGIEPDPEKLKVIRDFAIPRNKQQLQSFLGTCGYYRRFSLKHATFVEPFRDLLRRDVVWNWTNDHRIAFKRLKENFLNCVALKHILPNIRFKLQTDASDIGISAILYQIDSENNPRIVSLVSRVLTKYEINYTVTEKELLAIIYAVLKFRYYLIGSVFDIITDHKSLTFLLTSPFNSARLMRWTLALQEYDFTIIHCKGSDNVVADFFSRNFPNEDVQDNLSYLIWNFIKNSSPTDLTREKSASVVTIESLRMRPELINEVKNISEKQQLDQYIQTAKVKALINWQITEEEGVCYVKPKNYDSWKLFLPITLVLITLRSIHEQLGHAGAFKMYKYIERFFYCRGMRRDVKKFTKSCDLCQRCKFLNYKMEGSYQFLKASKPNELVSVDFFGPLPR